MVKEMALEFNELDYLRAESSVNALKLAKYKELVESYETRSKYSQEQIELLSRMVQNYKVQLEAKKSQKDPRYGIDDLGKDALKFLAGAAVMLLLLVSR